MSAMFDVRIRKVTDEAVKSALAHADDTLRGRGVLPEKWYLVAAKAPWQTLLWAIMRLLFVAGFGFLSVVLWITSDAPRLDAVPGAPFVPDRGVQVMAVIFLVWAIYLLWRAVVKFSDWWRYTKRFLLWTPEFFLERKEGVVTVVPWKSIQRADVFGPGYEVGHDADDTSNRGHNDPGIQLSVGGHRYVISCAQSVSPVAGSNRSAWYNVVPGSMAFSPQPAYYVEGVLAIKRRIEEYMRNL